MVIGPLRPALCALVLLAGCSGLTDPFPGVVTRVEVEEMGAGSSTLLLRAIATNLGDETLHLGHGCGPGLDFRVRLPTGEVRDLLRGLPSTCPIFDSNRLEPGETDTVTIDWAPPVPGVYRVAAGVRTSRGTEAISAPVQVRVP